MLRLTLARLVRALVTIVLVVSFAFVVLRVSGDPAMLILSNETPPEVLAAFRKAWGLDDPIWVQYFRYFGALAHGEFGQSMRDGRAALDVVLERIPATLALTIPAFVLKIVIGIPLGVYAALHRDRAVDRIVMVGAVAGFTVPSFVLGLLLILLFAVHLGWLPTGGAADWRYAILPIVTLGIGDAAILARFSRSAMLEVLNQPYIRNASAKGVPWRRVVRDHALPNTMIPTVTIVGFMVGNLIAGAVLVESIFSWPGLGRLLVVSVASRDLAVVQCILLLVALTMVIANIVVDLLYGLLDPRLRRMGRRQWLMPAAGTPWVIWLAAFWLVLMVVLAIFADRLAPFSPTEMDLHSRLAPPSLGAHLMGTDELGRDVFSRLLSSIRVSLMVAMGATLISAVLGTALGFLAAHFRGWIENLVLTLVDFQAAMPFLILALSVLAFFGNALPLFIGLMGLYGWERYARIARGLALAAGAQGYAGAIRNIGAGAGRTYLRHILPNIASPLIVAMTLTFPEIILMESGLSFLGLGVQPPMSSLGNMLGYGRDYLTSAPWIMLAPAATIVLATLAISLIGDFLRDRLDPTLS